MKKLFGLLLLGFATLGLRAGDLAAADSITYIDDRKISTEALLKQVESIISKHQEWGISALRERFNSSLEGKKISVPNLPPHRQQVISGAELYNLRAPGVLMVGRYYDCGNCPLMHTGMSATAAVITEDGICVTNDHVIESLLRSRSGSGDIDSVAFVGTIDGKVYPIVDVLSVSKVADIALFKVDTRGDKLSPIPLGHSMQPGKPVRAITHPSGNFYYYSEGVVARNTINSAVGPMSKRMEITADYAVGSSGGPIFDEAGNLVGIVSTTRSLEAGGNSANTGGRGQNTSRQHQMTIKHTIPVELIKSLLQP